MKKLFSFIMALVVIVTALAVNVGTASAASSSVVIYLPGITQEELKGASVFVNSEYYHVECTLKESETGKVVCHIPGKYAGEDVVLYVAGQMFYATVPQPNSPDAKSCPEGEVFWYSFDVYYDGDYDGFGEMPAWVWDIYASSGFFEFLESMGYTFMNNGTFCAPDEEPT